MLSGHVVGDRPFWPYPRGEFPCPASFSAEPFRRIGSLLGLNSDVPGSGLRRFALAKLPRFPMAFFHKGRIQAQALASFHFALYQIGQPKLSLRDSQPAHTAFSDFFG